ncbi:MAG TPA: hypothetical protein VFC46_05845 [Humisphaera sp.]|nr:hypothetical protein [Humisphaera sp.]
MLESALALLGAMGAILLTWMLLGLWLTAIGLSVARIALGSRPSFDSLDHRGRSDVAIVAFRRVRLGGRVFGNGARCDDASAKADPTGWDLRPMDLVTAPWLGLAALLEFLQLWHLFLPVGGLAFLALAICGSVAFAFNADRIIQCIHDNRASWRGTALPFSLAVLWLANRAIGPCLQYDSAFYHLAGVRWANEFPIEKGLGNLFPPFALNNSNLLLNAMMEFGPWRGRSSHLFNGFFGVLMIPVIVEGFQSILIDRGRRAAAGLFAALTCVLLVKYAVTSDLASPSTDMPAALFGLFGAWRLFRMLLRLPRSSAEWDYDFLLTTVVLSATVTLKLSAIFFVAIAWPIAAAAWMQRRCFKPTSNRSRSALVDRWRPLGAALFLSAALIGTWSLRGYLLSGFPLFPSAIGGIHDDWRVSEPARLNDIAALERVNKTIYLNRQADISAFHWAPAWFADTFVIRSGAEGLLPACIAVGSMVLALWPGTGDVDFKSRSRRAQRVRSARNAGWLLMAPAIIALIIWFVKVPAPRMGAMPWWVVAATAASMALLRQPTRWLPCHRKSILCGGAIVTLLPLLHIFALIQFRYRHDPNMAYYGIPAWRIVPFYSPGPDHGFYPLRNPELIESRADSGLRVYMPKPPGQDLWYAPLPGTPDLNPKLRLRKPGSMSAGFTVQP